MATPHSIPSKLSTTADVEVTPVIARDSLYITAILVKGDVLIDDVNCEDIGPIALPSPIVCSAFTPDAAGQVAYYEQ